jgi:hypothetical protein
VSALGQILFIIAAVKPLLFTGPSLAGRLNGFKTGEFVAMKNHSVCIIIFAACLFLEGCVSSQSDASGQSAPRSAGKPAPATVESIIPFDEKDPESARLEIRLALSESAGLDLDAKTGNLIRELLYKGQSAEDYGRAVAAEHERLYAGLRAEWIPQGGARMASFNWYYTEKVENRTISVKGLMPGREKLLVLTKITESYLGGAHGNSSTACFVIDPAAAKHLALDDIFSSPEELRLLLEAELRRQYKLPEGAPLSSAGFFEDRIELPENFSLAEAPGNSSGGPSGDSPFMRFLWNTYEIAPHAMGAIEVSLPLGSLSPLFRK